MNSFKGLSHTSKTESKLSGLQKAGLIGLPVVILVGLIAYLKWSSSESNPEPKSNPESKSDDDKVQVKSWDKVAEIWHSVSGITKESNPALSLEAQANHDMCHIRSVGGVLATSVTLELTRDIYLRSSEEHKKQSKEPHDYEHAKSAEALRLRSLNTVSI
ncbi:hypothetical protein FACS189465_3300 [Clostridia bacterium]|nr:hypothetical protein FACS189465_3300 [Clostridia bacterium]